MRVLSFATQIEPFEQAINKRLYVCCKYSTSFKFVSRHLSPESRAFSQPARAQSILYTLFSCLLRLRYYVVSPLHQFDNAMQGNHWSEVKDLRSTSHSILPTYSAACANMFLWYSLSLTSPTVVAKRPTKIVVMFLSGGGNKWVLYSKMKCWIKLEWLDTLTVVILRQEVH